MLIRCSIFRPFCIAPKHRGFAFVTFSSAADAQDAIDNMDMNELQGRVLKVNLARPMKAALNPQGNRASAFDLPILVINTGMLTRYLLYTVWESEEWLKEHVKPLAQSGGPSLSYFVLSDSCMYSRNTKQVFKDVMQKAQNQKRLRKRAMTMTTLWRSNRIIGKVNQLQVPLV
jgi:RNA recognition motif-containing protein